MEKSKAYIIANNEIIAVVNTSLKNGESISYSKTKAEEAINAAREFNLVNASTGKISRATKWDGKARKMYEVDSGEEINAGEFWIY